MGEVGLRVPGYGNEQMVEKMDVDGNYSSSKSWVVKKKGGRIAKRGINKKYF